MTAPCSSQKGGKCRPSDTRASLGATLDSDEGARSSQGSTTSSASDHADGLRGEMPKDTSQHAEHGNEIELTAAMSRMTERSTRGEVYSIFTPLKITLLVYLASWSASFSALSAQIYFPAITDVARGLNITPQKVNISVTLYMIFQGLAPSFWGPLSDRKGRRIIILATFTVYLGACLGLALTETYAQLLVLRALQSTGSASTIAIGAGILGDITTRENRGGYMGIFQAALNLPLAVGPIIGGAMAETVGWHAIFWFLLAYSGAFVLFAAVFLPETLRAIVGNGSIVPSSFLQRCPTLGLWVPRDLRVKPAQNDDSSSIEAGAAELQQEKPTAYQIKSILRPVSLLLRRDVFLSVTFLALHYTMWQMAVTAMSTLFDTVYGLNVLDIGLTFISNGVGCIVGTLVLGRILDRNYARLKAKSAARKVPISTARARLQTAWLYSLAEAAMLILFGWTVDRKIHIAVPIVSMFFMTVSAVSIQASVNTFLVDNFPKEGASVTATLNLARCWLGAGGAAAILPLGKAIGIGWSFSMLAFILLAANILLIALLWNQEGFDFRRVSSIVRKLGRFQQEAHQEHTGKIVTASSDH